MEVTNMVSAHIPLAKVYHVAKPKTNELGTYTRLAGFSGKSQGHGWDILQEGRRGAKSWDQ